MTLEKLLLSIIVDDRMGRLNSAIEEVYGVNAVEPFILKMRS